MQKYATCSQLCSITGLSIQTVRARKRVIEECIQRGRYNEYAISGRLVSIPVFLDANKYYDYLTSPGYENLIPEFDESKAKMYL